MTRPFWETTPLDRMTPEQWESLCDGCGLCCLVRFEDADSGEIIPTRVHCRLLDAATCRCSNYPDRKQEVPDCITLTPEVIPRLGWMPRSCAYRRLQEGRGLADWHPLVSGDPESVHRAGVSVRGQTLSETELAHEDDMVDHAAPDLLRERGLGD
ncbi:MAG: YcgN family cysteine cluster protein [Phenylobacterium sp.]|uniref:YcgN family cysteine cluster protein n=1 Tax=Phenylobacterium sp. TaxID=1871053 RepID=UPI0025FEC192|nr:YcgN family cysteine cluster protein [Phenylobacterium sp.]MCA6243537.1 YcgN family cysteine cluster protein [Phenylobacterium sp.]MCA6247723.1 YcgN family cysteine cluster protein [Phenylobacterium sp.]